MPCKSSCDKNKPREHAKYTNGAHLLKQVATKVNDETTPNANGAGHVKQVATKVNHETTPNVNGAGHACKASCDKMRMEHAM